MNAPLVASGIYGVIIVVVMLFRPQGLIPERRRKLEFEDGVHDEPSDGRPTCAGGGGRT